MSGVFFFFFFFFFNDTATTEIYTLSLHDALPPLRSSATAVARRCRGPCRPHARAIVTAYDHAFRGAGDGPGTSPRGITSPPVDVSRLSPPRTPARPAAQLLKAGLSYDIRTHAPRPLTGASLALVPANAAAERSNDDDQ